MIFFEPLVQALLRFGDYRRFAALAERRDALEALTTLSSAAPRSRRARRAARARPREERPAPTGAPGAKTP